ncbi:MAG: aldehyde dehydrogenase family protein, partial [Pyrinomonadaceae bacterium]
MRKKILIGGEWRDAGESIEVKSPYTNETLAEVASVNRAGLEEVISIAEKAAKEMRNLPRFKIAKGLRKIADGIESRKKEFAETIANEAAKPIKTALGEVERSIATFIWAAGEAERFTGEIVPIDTIQTGKGKTGFTK